MGATNTAKISRPITAAKPVSLFLMTNTFETGGSERQYSVLARNLDAQKFGVHLGCVSHRGALAAEFAQVPEFPLGGSLFGLRSLRTRLALRRHLRKHYVDVAHAFEFYSNLTLIPAARVARVPVVIGSHRQIGDLMSPAQFRAQAAALRWCDAVICNSQAAADSLVAAGIAGKKLAVIGNALPDELFEPAVPAVPRKPGVIRVGMVARMNAAYKNHAGFLRIAAQVRKSVPNVEFLLAGDGPLRAELEKQAADLGMGNHVIFLGDRRDVSAVLASMDLAVLTSNSESLSNVILEAMAAGLPVVAYDAGGNKELVNEERGALVELGNEPLFAAAVVRLASSPEGRGQLGEQARRFVQQKFALSRVLRRYEDLYNLLLARKLGGKRHDAGPSA